MEWEEVRSSLLEARPMRVEQVKGADTAGLYCWWDLGGALMVHYPTGFPSVDTAAPLYVGIAAKQTIASRGISMHLRRTRMSTLRRSLAALLADELDLLQGVELASKGEFGLDDVSEQRLTTWMAEHLAVTWVAHASPGSVEAALVRDLLPPLNDHFAHAADSWRLMREVWSGLLARSRGLSS